jgi:hypothetical protein
VALATKMFRAYVAATLPSRAEASTGKPSARPFMSPPRNASPTPVGSTIRCGTTAGTSTRPLRVNTEDPCSPRVTISASDDDRISSSLSPVFCRSSSSS